VTPRRLGALAGVVTLVASGAYVFVYLYRWEWNRAQISAAIFIGVEVGLLGWYLADRLRSLSDRVDQLGASQHGRRLEILRSTAPAQRVTFEWLRDASSRTNVFIPVLLGAGAALSGIAWLLERLSRATAGRVAEHGLAAKLAVLDVPTGGFLARPHDPTRVLRGPVP